MGGSSFYFLGQVVELYSYLVLATVLLSWFPIDADNPLVLGLRSLTEPLLNPLRQLLNPNGGGTMGLDFSPMVALILLQMLAGYLKSH